MEIKIIELKPNKARVVFIGEGHTFMNVLTKELLADPGVDVAQYMIEFHFSDPELLVTTLGERGPVDAIRDACLRLSEYCDDLQKQIAKGPS